MMKRIVKINHADGFFVPKIVFSVCVSVLNQYAIYGVGMRTAFMNAANKYRAQLVNDGLTFYDCASALRDIIANDLFQVVEIPADVQNIGQYFKEHPNV